MKKIIISLVIVISEVLSLYAQERGIHYYIGQAEANSPLIYQARKDIETYSLDLLQINRILFKPEINVVSGFTFSPIISRTDNRNSFHLVSDGATDYTGHDLAVTDGGQYQALISVRQPLLADSKYRTYIKNRDISQQISENDIALTIHELEQLIGYQYLLCLKSAKEAENTLSLVRDLEEKYTLITQLVGNGIYKQTDLILLQIELGNYRMEYKGYRADYLSNLFDLNLICGINDTVEVDLPDIDLELNPSTGARSGFLVGYKLDSLKILSDMAVNELKYKPQFDFIADAGLNAAYLPNPKRIGISAGLALTWNIFDGHQRNIQREKSAINLQALEFRKNNFMTRNEISRNRILKQISSLDERIRMSEKQAENYITLIDAYTRELSLGEASIMDFKNLLKDIAANRSELIQLRIERQFMINSFNYLNF